jgi:glutamyl-tRNA reductase
MMYSNPEAIIGKLCVVGVNYRHANVSARSLFSIPSSACHALLEDAKGKGIRSLFILSTCNRTELYAYCHHEDDLVNLLIQYSNGTKDIFQQSGFARKGADALTHLFHIAAGIGSQIIGDFEILGQLKNAIVLSRQFGMIGPVMDRTINLVLQASKEIRTHTALSGGTISVSYAAIEWLRKINGIRDKKILLFGTGKFGEALAKNLSHYFPATAVTVINRTDKKAIDIATSLSFTWKPFISLVEETKYTDIIIVCTDSPDHTLLPHFFTKKKYQWILDLSVPENAHPAIKNIPGISVTGIDEVSELLKNTLAKRSEELPKALLIIEKYRKQFYEWLHLQRHVPLINEMKDKLYGLGEVHLPNEDNTRILSTRVNKTVGSLAMNLRYRKEKGCHYISAINEFLQPDASNE